MESVKFVLGLSSSHTGGGACRRAARCRMRDLARFLRIRRSRERFEATSTTISTFVGNTFVVLWSPGW